MTVSGSKTSATTKSPRKGRLNSLKKHRDNLNILISKVKIKPYDYFTYPLGLFDKKETPRGFCIAVKPDSIADELVGVQTRIRPVQDKVEYSLIIANRSKKAFYAEISKL